MHFLSSLLLLCRDLAAWLPPVRANGPCRFTAVQLSGLDLQGCRNTRLLACHAYLGMVVAAMWAQVAAKKEWRATH